MTERSRQWQVIVLRQPQRMLRRLPRDLAQRLRKALRELAADPRPAGARKLVGYGNLFRVRVGDWRILYAIEDDRLVVIVTEIVPRGNAYRDL